MLTKEDLKAIKSLISDELKTELNPVNKRLSSIEKDIKSIKQDIKLIKECVSTENAKKFPRVKRQHDGQIIQMAAKGK